MKILFWKCESTGLVDWPLPSEDPRQPRIVELAAELWDDGQKVDGFDTLVATPKLVPPEVTALHGLTNDILNADGILPTDAMRQFLDLADAADNLAAWAVRFETRLIRIEMAQLYGIKWEPPVEPIDVCSRMKPFARVMKAKPRTHDDYKQPKLIEAWEAIMGRPWETRNRLAAGHDCAAMSAIFFEAQRIANA